MSKWKCGICNSEFDNFQAQGFDETIYCPLCYFKELYRRTKIERDRLNNIIEELEKWIKENNLGEYRTENVVDTDELLDKLKELKENNKDAC